MKDRIKRLFTAEDAEEKQEICIYGKNSFW